jgi:hypothetical protein
MNRPAFDGRGGVTGVLGAAASSFCGSGAAGVCAAIRSEDANVTDTTTTIH